MIEEGSNFLSIVLPVFNKECIIKENIELLTSYLSSKKYIFEILIVDDGSTDKTSEIAKTLQAKYRNLIFLQCSRNKGKGYAVKKGIVDARGKYFFYIDADLAYSLDSFDKGLEELKEYDIVYGNRRHKDTFFRVAPQKLRYVYIRDILGRIFNIIVRKLLGISVTDTQSGFKGFRAEVAKDIFPRMKLHGFAFDIEIFVIAKILDYKEKGFPVELSYRESDESAVHLLPDSLKMFKDVIRIKFSKMLGRYLHFHS